MRVLTPYKWHTGKLSAPVRLAVVSDLHNEAYDDILPMLEGADALLVPGDIANRYKQAWDTGVAFLKDAARLLPVFFTVGNHETKLSGYRSLLSDVEATGAVTLINAHQRFGDIWIGGWYPPDIVREPDMLNEFEALEGCKVLMCHKPNYHKKYLAGRDIDLVVAGHAHGGQVRVFNQGLFSPGQGPLPRYTRGVACGNMVISAGAGNPNRLPRWNNPTEVLMITID